MGVRGEESSRGEGRKRVREGRVRRERVRKGRVGRGRVREGKVWRERVSETVLGGRE